MVSQAHRSIFFVFLAALFAFPLKAQLAASSNVVLVFFGGFNSCKDANSPKGLRALPFVKKVESDLVKNGNRVTLITSCYLGIDSSSIVWQSSEAPGETYSLKWNQPDEPGQLFDEIVRVSRDFQDQMIIMGHSYGGWLATNFAAHLTAKYGFGKAESSISLLATIDPISPYHCDQFTYAGTVISLLDPLNESRASGDCQKSPPQISRADGYRYPGQLDNIAPGRIGNYAARSTQYWLNFYQSADILHSSPIEIKQTQLQPRLQNYFIPYKASAPLGTITAAHTLIQLDKRLWKIIQTSLAQLKLVAIEE